MLNIAIVIVLTVFTQFCKIYFQKGEKTGTDLHFTPTYPSFYFRRQKFDKHPRFYRKRIEQRKSKGVGETMGRKSIHGQTKLGRSVMSASRLN